MVHRGVLLLLQCLALLLRVEASLPLTAATAEELENPPFSTHLLQKDVLPQLIGQEAGRGTARSNETQHAPGANGVPKVFINLDLPPKDRFREWARQMARRSVPPDGEEVLDVVASWINLAMSEEEQEDWVATLKRVIRPEHLEELEGIAEEYQGFMRATSRSTLPMPSTVDGLLLGSAIYELSYPELSCSGVLVARPDGTVIHGRNLDYLVIGYKGLLDTMEEVVYMKDGKPLYTVVSVGLPYLGITGMRFGGWTISQNTHWGNNRPLNLEVAKAGGTLVGWEMRNLLETVPDFSTAVERILRTKWMAPQYLILSGAGPSEGAVITLHRAEDEGTASFSFEPMYPAPLRITRKLAPEVGVWYLAQTNDEVWGTPEDLRRPFEQRELERVGREGMDEAAVMRLLKTPPAFQLDLFPLFSNGDNLTLFTAVFNLAQGSVWLVRGNETFEG